MPITDSKTQRKNYKKSPWNPGMSQIPVSGGIFYALASPRASACRAALFAGGPGAGFSLYKFAVNDCVRGLGGRIQNRLKKL